MAKTNPAVIINEYLKDALPLVLPEYYSSTTMAFVPSKPTDIASFYSNAGSPDAEIPLAVYERMFKLRRGSFPHIKCEQLLYYMYVATGESSESQAQVLLETTQAIFELLDRGDETAKEINDWQAANLTNGYFSLFGTDFNPIYFHELKIFQLEEARDIIDFATAETYTGNKIIVDYDYNAPDFNSSQPFFKDGSFNNQ